MGALLLALLATAALLGAGLAWARALRTSAPLAAAAALGPLALVEALVALELAGAPLRPWTLGPALLLLAALAWPARRLLDRLAPPPPDLEPDGEGWRSWPAWGLAAPLGLGLLLVARCALYPLPGVDVSFRWGWLAERLIVDGTLGFYPPRSAADWRTYFWPDGIPPLVSGCYAWVWGWLGEAAPRAATPLLLVQWVASLALAGRLAARLAPADPGRAGALAAGLFALCPLAWRAVAIGQETGWTTLALLGVAWAVAGARGPFDPRAMALAGAFAALGGLAREYGLVFAGLAALLAWRRGQGRAGLLVLIGVAGLLLAPWYLRTWGRTGNPLFAHGLGPLFVPPVYVGHRAARVAEQGWTLGAAQAALLMALRDAAGPLLAGGAALLVAPAARLVLAPVAVVAALWAWSVPQTDAGLFYSLRVLAPACGLLAAAGGVLLARGVADRRGAAAVAVAALALGGWAVTVAAAHPRLPEQMPPGAWLRQQLVPGRLAAPAEQLEAELLAALPPGAVGLGTDPYAHALLRREGRTLLAPWSPEAAFLCDPALDDRERLARLRALGVVATVCGEEDEVRFARRWPGWDHVRRLPVVLRARGIVVRRVE